MTYILVNAAFTPGVVDGGRASRDHLCMARKVIDRLKPDKGPTHFIKEWREFRGLTQEQLAERVDTTHATISRIETGKSSYTQARLEAIAWALQCTPADLLIRDPSDPEGIWSIWDQLAPEQRAQIVDIAKTFRKAS